MTTNVYVVVTGSFGSDVAGVSVAADRLWFQHVSSSTWFLERDTTDGFADRKAQLDAAYPDGWTAVLVEVGAPLPDEVAHHFEPA